ncbi:MAG TPA: 7-cyano-7-deazaguanine synthase, partial [Burkholderiales bacterium]|nr:7-cyano-7-deazaguanine synthase [Burkholderiales bacterium]
LDSPEYPDTRREFVRAMEKAVNLGTAAAFGGPKIHILAPFIGLRKSAIIRRGLRLGANYAYSVSCYAGREAPCGTCSSCLLRREAWREAGREDPLLARLRKEGRR